MNEDIINRLTDRNDKTAYEFAKKIAAQSGQSDQYLEMIDDFASLLDNESSYVRTRAFLLITSQSRWADKQQIEKVFYRMKPLLNDEKPTVVRQCLKGLHEVVLFREEMAEEIRKAVNDIKIENYKDSMQPLIRKDIEELLKMID